jgi:hypothetical protein
MGMNLESFSSSLVCYFGRRKDTDSAASFAPIRRVLINLSAAPALIEWCNLSFVSNLNLFALKTSKLGFYFYPQSHINQIQSSLQLVSCLNGFGLNTLILFPDAKRFLITAML